MTTIQSQPIFQPQNLLMTIILSFLALTLSGCNQAPQSETSVVQSSNSTEVSETPTALSAESESTLPADAPIYNVSNMTAFEPYVFKDKSGNATGFDIDLLNAIAEKAGFGVHYHPTPWQGIFDTITSGKRDIVISVVTITPERKEFLSFSEPYINFKRSALVREELKDRSFEDLVVDDSIIFSVVEDSSSEKLLKELGVPEENIIKVATQFLSVKNVLTGKADAIFEETNMLKYYYKTYADGNSKFALIEYNTAPAQLGIAVKKGNTEVLDKINEGLAQVRADGTYDDIYAKWFGE